jgi:hypothetical protein
MATGVNFAHYTLTRYRDAVHSMRDAQRYYFKERTSAALAAAVKAEGVVDRLYSQVSQVLDDVRYWQTGQGATATEVFHDSPVDVVEGG